MIDSAPAEWPVIATLHFAVGTACVLCGGAAFLLRKGALAHRIAGRIFAASMTLLCLSGLYLSFSRSVLFTAFLALLALHAVATGWLSAAMKPGLNRFAMRIGLAGIALTGLGSMLAGGLVATLPAGELNGLAPEAFYALGGIGLLIALIDLSALIRREIGEHERIARHAWRMGFSLFIASFIFFFGNNDVLPEYLRAPAILSAPVVTVAGLTLYWLFRARFGRRFRG